MMTRKHHKMRFGTEIDMLTRSKTHDFGKRRPKKKSQSGDKTTSASAKTAKNAKKRGDGEP